MSIDRLTQQHGSLTSEYENQPQLIRLVTVYLTNTKSMQSMLMNRTMQHVHIHECKYIDVYYVVGKSNLRSISRQNTNISFCSGRKYHIFIALFFYCMYMSCRYKICESSCRRTKIQKACSRSRMDWCCRCHGGRTNVSSSKPPKTRWLVSSHDGLLWAVFQI